MTYELKEKAYHGNPEPENRIFAQYHKDYPNDMKKFIVNEIVKQNSTIRLVLATIALGMGLNAPCIQRIIHCRPPTTMEKYMQENWTCRAQWAPGRSSSVLQTVTFLKDVKGYLQQ